MNNLDTQLSRLDTAYANMQNPDGDETAELRFYETFCDCVLTVLIVEDEAQDKIQFDIFETSQGALVLAFDSEDRMAEFIEKPTGFINMPGRELLQMLSDQQLGIGLNLAVAPSSQILEKATLDWVRDVIGSESMVKMDKISSLKPATNISPSLSQNLAMRLQAFYGFVESVLICDVTYEDGYAGTAFFVLNCDPDTEANLFAMLMETQRFSSRDDSEIAIQFIQTNSPNIDDIRAVAQEVKPLPRSAKSISTPKAPGRDPAKPPKLR